jgi:DNA-binding transcriptional MocR family regulator
MGTPWSHRFAQRTRTIKSSAIRELLKLTQQPDVISFAGGLPAPEVFPVQRFQQACQKVLDTAGPARCSTAPRKVICHRGKWSPPIVSVTAFLPRPIT